MLANLLAREHITTALVEQRTALPPYSMAIGVTPPSLELLSELGLADCFVHNGIRIGDVSVFDKERCLGRLSFDSIGSEFKYILAIPQRKTMAYLKECVSENDSITVYEGFRFQSCREMSEGVEVQLHHGQTSKNKQLTTHYVVGCDGVESQVRDGLAFSQKRTEYRETFVMGEFDDHTGLGEEARLYFTVAGSVESFPLPEGRRRWITMMPATVDDKQTFLVERVKALAGFDLKQTDCRWISTFRPARRLCQCYGRGRVSLCGDAAHMMSPIGGQGMNTGFADAAYLASVLAGALRHGQSFELGLSRYSKERKRAFSIAAKRAALGMWVGTRTGLRGCVRSVLVRYVLSHSVTQRWLAQVFSMVNLPGQRDPRVKHSAHSAIQLKTAFDSSENKRLVNRAIFAVVAPKYAMVTKLLSLGRDTVWKRKLIADLPALDGPVCADLACGNGDLIARLLQKYPSAIVTGIDQSPEMLQEAACCIKQPNVCFRKADLLHTGIKRASCDIVTAGYALRNAPDLEQAICEAARVLKPNGYFAVLDFSRSHRDMIFWLQYVLLWFWGGLWGLILHRDARVYGYIAASLRHFPDRPALIEMLRRQGLCLVSSRCGLGGMVTSLLLQKRGSTSG